MLQVDSRLALGSIVESTHPSILLVDQYQFIIKLIIQLEIYLLLKLLFFPLLFHLQVHFFLFFHVLRDLFRFFLSFCYLFFTDFDKVVVQCRDVFAGGDGIF